MAVYHATFFHPLLDNGSLSKLQKSFLSDPLPMLTACNPGPDPLSEFEFDGSDCFSFRFDDSSFKTPDLAKHCDKTRRLAFAALKAAFYSGLSFENRSVPNRANPTFKWHPGYMLYIRSEDNSFRCACLLTDTDELFCFPGASLARHITSKNFHRAVFLNPSAFSCNPYCEPPFLPDPNAPMIELPDYPRFNLYLFHSTSPAVSVPGPSSGPDSPDPFTAHSGAFSSAVTSMFFSLEWSMSFAIDPFDAELASVLSGHSHDRSALAGLLSILIDETASEEDAPDLQNLDLIYGATPNNEILSRFLYTKDASGRSRLWSVPKSLSLVALIPPGGPFDDANSDD